MKFVGPITDWFIYKNRYAFAYLFLITIIGGLLIFHPSYIPSGVSQREIDSVVTSGSISLNELPNNMVNLPYHIAQKASTTLLGITPLGVRLPSIIFGTITAFAIGVILRRWFKFNVAFIASVIILTSSWFLSLARLGTPDIMIVFWSSTIMLLATIYSQNSKRSYLVKAGLGLSIALSLYTPYMIYMLAAMLLSITIQPHLRYLFHETSKLGYFIASFIALLILTPLGIATYYNLTLLLDLLNLRNLAIHPMEYVGNIVQLFANILNPSAISNNELIYPLISLTVVILISLGVYRIFRDAHSIRSHVLIIWLTIITTIMCLNPHNITALFLPLMLIMAIGLNMSIMYWFKLFPRNPYARIFGLLPIGLLIFSMFHLEYVRYFNTMFYAKNQGIVFQTDVFMAQNAVKNMPDGQPITLVVFEKNQAIYKLIAQTRPGTTVITSDFNTQTTDTIIISSDMLNSYKSKLGTPTRLIVNDRSNDSMRFAIYER